MDWAKRNTSRLAVAVQVCPDASNVSADGWTEPDLLAPIASLIVAELRACEGAQAEFFGGWPVSGEPLSVEAWDHKVYRLACRWCERRALMSGRLVLRLHVAVDAEFRLRVGFMELLGGPAWALMTSMRDRLLPEFGPGAKVMHYDLGHSSPWILSGGGGLNTLSLALGVITNPVDVHILQTRPAHIAAAIAAVLIEAYGLAMPGARADATSEKP